MLETNIMTSWVRHRLSPHLQALDIMKVRNHSCLFHSQSFPWSLVTPGPTPLARLSVSQKDFIGKVQEKRGFKNCQFPPCRVSSLIPHLQRCTRPGQKFHWLAAMSPQWSLQLHRRTSYLLSLTLTVSWAEPSTVGLL